jgi:hypothetical protein
MKRTKQASDVSVDVTIAHDEARLLRQCLGEIETVRRRRQTACQSTPHPAFKRFTQQELAEEVCPTYKNLLVGRSKRLPSRAMILKIAEYLECTIAEQSDLLISAGYLPQAVWMRDDLFRSALANAKHIAAHSTLPTYVCSPDLQVVYINKVGQKLTQRPDVDKLSDIERLICGASFIPDGYSRFSNSPTPEDWQRNASAGVRIYRSNTRVFQFEPWYKDRLERLKRLPDFETYWDQAVTSQHETGCVGRCRSYLVNGLLTLSAIVSTIGGPGGPIVYSTIPVNDVAREALRKAGASSTQYL